MHYKVIVPVVVEDEEFLPLYASPGAAGADLKAHIQEDLVIPPSESRLIPTGLRMAIPEGYELQIRPRSGLALKSQVTVLNTPGTIDSDYRGEVGVILINHGKNPFVVTPGMRIAQGVVARFEQAAFVIEEALQSTIRGEGGFGHSGTH
jgi:dUTP pyrophosphatase